MIVMGNGVILDLCGGSGNWSKPYAEADYDVLLIDIQLPDRCGAVFGDVAHLERLPFRVIGVLAAPPCTMFSRAGNRWIRSPAQMAEALRVVDACLRIVKVHEPDWWALENPVGKLSRYLGPPRMTFNPCDYGDPYTKLTALWGDFKIPKKNPVEPMRVDGGHHSQDAYLLKKFGRMPRSTRAALRSQTPPGFAKAFFEVNA